MAQFLNPIEKTVPFLYFNYSSFKHEDRIHMPYKRKKDGTANRFGSAVPSSFGLVISVPLGDTFCAFDASLDVCENQHDVVQLIGR